MKALDLFCGEGGAGMGYHRAGFTVTGVDKAPARLRHYPFECHQADAIEFVLAHGHEYDLIHASPTCTGYSRGTAAIPDRLERYDRLIGAVREALRIVGRPYVIENVADARSELVAPIMLCGRMFGLSATDDDGTPLVMDRHRLFESSVFLMAPPHLKHDRSVQVAGSYGGARRDKREAREIRKGGYVPSVEVQRELLGTPWCAVSGLMEDYGIFGGLSGNERRRIRKRYECGTDAGYQRHRRRGETVCEECRVAHNEAQHARRVA